MLALPVCCCFVTLYSYAEVLFLFLSYLGVPVCIDCRFIIGLVRFPSSLLVFFIVSLYTFWADVIPAMYVGCRHVNMHVFDTDCFDQLAAAC
jgi:hypothetical protein